MINIFVALVLVVLCCFGIDHLFEKCKKKYFKMRHDNHVKLAMQKCSDCGDEYAYCQCCYEEPEDETC